MRTRYGLSMGLAILCGALAGCATDPLVDSSRLTALQIRSIQTRTYEGDDAKATLKTVLNVLQDEGFLVDYGNADLGLLHGSKTLDEIAAQKFGLEPAHFEHSFGFDGLLVNIVTIEATANISGFDNGMKVRINFQRKLTDFRGVVIGAAPVVDAKVYQEFFAKVERGLFIQKQGL